MKDTVLDSGWYLEKEDKKTSQHPAGFEPKTSRLWYAGTAMIAPQQWLKLISNNIISIKNT